MLADRARIDPPVARHAEVEHQSVAAVGVDQAVFGTAAKSAHPRPGKPLAKIDWKRATKVGATRLDARQAAALKHLGQAADRRLDFGKLGHGVDMAKGCQAR